MSNKKTKKNQDEFIFGGTHPSIYHPFVSALIPGDLSGKTILDIGCGKGTWGFIIRSQRDLSTSNLIGVDLNPNYLSFIRKHNLYEKVLAADITKRIPLKDHSVDFIICSEVIEHMTKKQGETLLKEIDRLIKDGGRVIITTPNVWLEMPFDNKLDRHYSLWNVNDFRKRGYGVRGVGIKLPFNKQNFLTPLIHALYFITTPFAFVFPELSGLLIAYKDYK